MEIKTFFGLPAHPLFVHLPVVLIPLAGLIALAFAIRPKWLDRYGLHLVVLSLIGAAGGVFAAGSGEGLEGLQNEAESAAREQHFTLGETARNLGLLFFLVVLAVVLLRRYAMRSDAQSGIAALARTKAAAVVMSLALVLSAGAASIAVARAGHQGAELVWNDDEESAPVRGDQPRSAVSVRPALAATALVVAR